MRRDRGLTLLELAVALAVVVSIGILAVPYLLALLPQSRVNAASHLLVADFRLARTLSVARGVDVLIAFDSPAFDRYRVAYDTDPAPPNNDHQITDRDELIKTVDIAALYKGVGFARYGAGAPGKGPSGSALPDDGISFQDRTSIFNPDGRARAGSVYLRPTHDAGVTRLNERCVTVIGSTSRARLYAWRGTSWE